MWSLLRALFNRLTTEKTREPNHRPAGGETTATRPAPSRQEPLSSPLPTAQTSRLPASPPPGKGPQPPRTRRADGFDKHGFPRLTGREDMHRLFTGDTHRDQQETFIDLIERGRDAEQLQGADSKEATRSAHPATVSPRKSHPYPHPEAELDLHGLTARQATMKSDFFIRNAHGRGCNAIRIITGKGLHSEGNAVLPDVIEELLVSLKDAGIILTFRWERRAKRKSGALLVYFP